ncbi:MAG: hypothetical protein OXU81_20835 [Gammaproteobacteria bacterium]|nr:hypothetical protein [Gammaproteobacteria bacterium]
MVVGRGAQWSACAILRLLLGCLALTHAVASAGVAGAEPIHEARAAYAEGRFVDAARIGETLGTSQGLALAAESLTIHAHFIASKDEKEALFQRAAELARQAVRADPGNADAHLQLAHAIGRHAQTVGSLEAANRGYAAGIREATEAALQLDPEMAAAHLSLGLWHAEIIGAVGSFLAYVTYGARARDAVASFERALELAPDSKAASLECALGLLALDENKYRERARRLLKRAIEIPTMDAYDRLLDDQALERLGALDSSTTDDARTVGRDE